MTPQTSAVDPPKKKYRPRNPDKKKAVKSFRDWIDTIGGTLHAAILIGVSERAVKAWLRGEYSPTLPRCEQIVKLSKGVLTVAILRDRTKMRHHD